MRIYTGIRCAHPYRYWISVISQYWKGAPAGYGVLAYEGAANDAELPGASHAYVQPQQGFEQKKWDIGTTMSLSGF